MKTEKQIRKLIDYDNPNFILEKSIYFKDILRMLEDDNKPKSIFESSIKRLIEIYLALPNFLFLNLLLEELLNSKQCLILKFQNMHAPALQHTY